MRPHPRRKSTREPARCPGSQDMLQTQQLKRSLSADKAFNEIGVDIWSGVIAEMLEMPQTVHMRAVSKSFHTIFSDDDMWLDRLTLLSLRHPTLADLAKGAEETAYAWYIRCHAAAADGNVVLAKEAQSECEQKIRSEEAGMLIILGKDPKAARKGRVDPLSPDGRDAWVVRYREAQAKAKELGATLVSMKAKLTLAEKQEAATREAHTRGRGAVWRGVQEAADRPEDLNEEVFRRHL